MRSIRRLPRLIGVVFYPFFLDGVAADAKLNQRDGMHPNAAGVDVIVARILPKVEELIARARTHARIVSLESRPCRVFSPVSKFPPMSAQSLAMLRGGLPGARWIDPENYHLTLRFIGDVDDDDRARGRLAARPGQARRVRIAARRLSSFGGKQAARDRRDASRRRAALMEVQAEQERLMQRIGLEPEGRKYTPHVTLARLRDSSSREVADYLSARGLFPHAGRFRSRVSCCFPRAPRSAAGLMWSKRAYPLRACGPAH